MPLYALYEGGYMKAAVLGSGAGALAVAADMSRHGRHTVLAGLHDSRADLEPVSERGGVLVSDGGQGINHPVPKQGGVLMAALPPTPPDKARLMDLIGDAWPCATATDTVWTTVLADYDAVERAATTLASAGTHQENRTGGMPPTSEDAGPQELTDAIEAVDAELLAPRRALNSKEPRGYQDFKAAQGLTPAAAPAAAPAPNPGHITTEVPCTLVLASSLSRAAGIPTPATDRLVAAAPATQGQDPRSEGRTLATLGLDGLDVTGLIGFARTGIFP